MIISQFYMKLHLWLWEMFKNAISRPFGHVEIDLKFKKMHDFLNSSELMKNRCISINNEFLTIIFIST